MVAREQWEDGGRKDSFGEGHGRRREGGGGLEEMASIVIDKCKKTVRKSKQNRLCNHEINGTSWDQFYSRSCLCILCKKKTGLSLVERHPLEQSYVIYFPLAWSKLWTWHLQTSTFNYHRYGENWYYNPSIVCGSFLRASTAKNGFNSKEMQKHVPNIKMEKSSLCF